MKKLKTTIWTLDLTQYSCSYALKYYTFLEITSSSRDCIRVPLLLFMIKSSLPGAATSFIYMLSSSSFSVSGSVAVSQPNLFHGAHTHKNPKAKSLMAASLQHLVNWSAEATVASILTKGRSPQLCANITIFCCLQDTFNLSGYAQQIAWRHVTSVCFFSS